MMRLSTRTKESIALVTQEQWNSPPGVFQKWLQRYLLGTQERHPRIH